MSVKSRNAGWVIVTVCAVLGVVGISASPAFAEPECATCKPWWHMTSGARPTNLNSESSLAPGQDDVQTLTIKATHGEYVLEHFENNELTGFAVLRFNAKAKEVETALEEGEGTYDGGNVQVSGVMYGKGNVEVTGGPGNEKGTEPYVITFTGALADQPVKPIVAESNFFNVFKITLPGECVSGEPESCPGEATVAETTQGRLAERQIVVTASNLGDADTSGPVTITDKLPAGLEAVGIEGIAGDGPGDRGTMTCSSTTLTCTFEKFEKKNAQGETEVVSATLPSYDQLEVRVGVVVKAGASSSEINEASISGGGAHAASIRRPITVSETTTPFGVEDYELTPEEEGGGVDTQVGSHPFQLTTTLVLNQKPSLNANGTFSANPVALPKDLSFKWPPGLIGNPTAVPRCTLVQFLAKPSSTCPAQSVVGVSMISYHEPKILGMFTETAPVYDIEASVGEPARFGFITPVGPVFIDPAVRSGGDYGITVDTNNITQTAGFFATETTIWGVPGDPRHDNQRGLGCVEVAREDPGSSCKSLEENQPPPFLSLPTSCPGSRLQSSVEADSWDEPGVFSSLSTEAASEPMPVLSGCNHLPFSPSIKVTPDGQQASEPSGLTTDVHVPQEESLNPNGLAESDVKDITVALPEGLDLNPADADGLSSCSEAQIGFTGVNPQSGADEIHPNGTVLSERVEGR